MSIEGPPDDAIDLAITNSINDGITYSIAAGNWNADACLASPSRIGKAITVGATNDTDIRWSISNYGTCLDIFAPGANHFALQR